MSAFRLLTVFALATGIFASAWADDFDDANAAYNRGEFKTAFDLIKPLAENGDAGSQTLIGVMYYEGKGVPQDYTEAVKWYRRAADQNFLLAQFNLAHMYAGGKGIEQDHKEAARLFRLVAEAGDFKSQTILGSIYYEGVGVPQDYREAAKWYQLAADQGDAIAQYNLGYMYFSGQGVPQDYVKAHMWWNLAAAQGHEPAAANRELVAQKMIASQIDEAQRLAREWLAAHPQ